MFVLQYKFSEISISNMFFLVLINAKYCDGGLHKSEWENNVENDR